MKSTKDDHRSTSEAASSFSEPSSPPSTPSSEDSHTEPGSPRSNSGHTVDASEGSWGGVMKCGKFSRKMCYRRSEREGGNGNFKREKR